MLLAAVLRFHQLESVPVGLDVDEAVDGWEAKRLLNGGCCPIFFTADYGEEPMHTYTVALLFRLFGVSVVYVRAASTIAGLLLVPVIYLLARELFPSTDASLLSVPILSAFWVATSYWHVTYSRAGMEPVYLPLFLSASAFCLWRAMRLHDRRLFVLAGCLLGAGLYTYRAVRLFPVLLLIFFGCRIIRDARFRQMQLRNLVLFAVSCLVVFLPLGLYAVSHPSMFIQREMTVGVFGAAADVRSVVQTTAETAARTFGMYNLVSDPQFERNPAHRPILDPLSSFFFITGLVTACVKRKDPAHAFVVLWLVVMSLPGALTPDVSPQYSRGIGALPAVALLFSLGVDSSKRWLQRRRSWPTLRRAYWPILGLALVTITFLSYRDYFFPWAERQRQGIIIGARDMEAATVMNQTYVPGGVWILPSSPVDAARLPFFQVSFLYEGVLPQYTLHADEPSCAQELSEICQGHNAALVVNWTDFVMERAYESENSDPKGLIDFLLRKYGERLASEAHNSFDLVTYRLPRAPDFAIASSFEPLAVDFGDELRLEGAAFGGSSLQDTSIPQEVEKRLLPSGKDGWVVLQWRAVREMDRDYKVAVYLLDGKRRVAGQVDKLLLSSHLETTSRWQPDQLEMDYYTLPSLPGTPPGEYTIEVAVYDAQSAERLQVLDTETGALAGSVSVGSLSIIRPVTPPQVEPMERISADESDIAPGLQLLGYDQLEKVASPGQTMRVGLYWRATEDLSQDYLLSLQLTDEGGTVWLEQQGRPVDGTYPTTEWQEGEILRDWHDVPLPPDAPQGLQQVELKVIEHGETVGEVSLGQLEIQGRPHQFDVPEMQHSVGATIGQGALFLGYDLEGARLRPGDTLRLTLYWQTLEEMQDSYTVFVHLLDEDQRIWGQMDSIPGQGAAPTTSWLSGEVISDRYEIAVSPEAPPGEYVVEIGMYDATTGERLPAFSDGLALEEDRVLLGAVQVIPRD
jgi:hypothetical protein